MLKNISLIILLFLTIEGGLHAQKMEAFGGVNQNSFYSRPSNSSSPSMEASYSSGNGFGVYMALDSLRYAFMVYRFTLGFEQYQGGYDGYSKGKVGGISQSGYVKKSKIMVGIYPGNFRLAHFDINLGVELGFLVNEKTTQQKDWWGVVDGRYDSNSEYYDNVSGFNKKVTADLKIRVAYDMYIAENLAISPMISANYGMSPEFNDFLVNTKSFRMFYGIGIERTLSK